MDNRPSLSGAASLQTFLSVAPDATSRDAPPQPGHRHLSSTLSATDRHTFLRAAAPATSPAPQLIPRDKPTKYSHYAPSWAPPGAPSSHPFFHLPTFSATDRHTFLGAAAPATSPAPQLIPRDKPTKYSQYAPSWTPPGAPSIHPFHFPASGLACPPLAGAGLPLSIFIPGETPSGSGHPGASVNTSATTFSAARPRNLIPGDAAPPLGAPTAQKRRRPLDDAPRHTKRAKGKDRGLEDVKKEPEEARGMLTFINEVDIPPCPQRPRPKLERNEEDTSVLDSQGPVVLHPVFRQDVDLPAGDGTRCICSHSRPKADRVECRSCLRVYHSRCVCAPSHFRAFRCPLCTLRRGECYEYAETSVRRPGQTDFSVDVDLLAMMRRGSHEMMNKPAAKVPSARSIYLLVVELVRIETEDMALSEALDTLSRCCDVSWSCPEILRVLQKAVADSYHDRREQDSKNVVSSAAELHEVTSFCDANSSVVSVLARHRRRSALLASLAMKFRIAAREDVHRAIEQDEVRMAEELMIALKYCPESILALRGDMANDFLNLLQELLDTSGAFKGVQVGGMALVWVNHDSMRQRGQHMMLQLSLQSGLLPSSFFLKKVHTDTSGHPIGSGAYADVYQGEYEGQLVALKRLRVFSDVSTSHKGFCREALPWRQLRHPHILPFLGIDCDSYAPYLCMVSPLMKNGNLMTYLQTRGRDDADLIGLMMDVADGLEYLHESHLVHGDLRAANVFVDDDGRACISDFGLVSLLECIDNNSSVGAGNPRWMAPELASDECRRSPASDVYSLSCLYLELITGKVPFAEIHVLARVTLKVANGERPTRPSDAQFPVGVSADEMWGLMERCWSQDSSSRPPAGQVYTELQGL